MENTNDFIPKGEVDINTRDINRANLSGNDADRNIGDLYARDQIRLIWEYLQRKPLVPVSTPSGQRYIELKKFKSGTASILIFDNSDLPVASIQVSSAARGGAGAIVNYGCSAPKILEISRNETDIYVKVDFTNTSKFYYSFEGVQSRMENDKPALSIVETASNNSSESYTITNLGGTVIFGKTQGDFVLGDISPTSVTTNNINITKLPNVILGTDEEGNVIAKKPPVYTPKVGETVTLEPKEKAVVELNASDSDYTATYTFKIPRGEKGEPGDVSQVIKDEVKSVESTWSSEKISKYVENLKSKNFTFVVDSEETLKLWTADTPDTVTYDFTSVLIRRTLPEYTFNKSFDLSKPGTKYIYAETDTKLNFTGNFGFKSNGTEAENLHVKSQGVAFNGFTQLLNCSAEAQTACNNCINISNFKAVTANKDSILFNNCNNLNNIYVKPAFTGFTGFSNCKNLNNIIFEDSKEISGISFDHCEYISNCNTSYSALNCENFSNVTNSIKTPKATIKNAVIDSEMVKTEHVDDLTSGKSSLGEAKANNLTAETSVKAPLVESDKVVTSQIQSLKIDSTMSTTLDGDSLVMGIDCQKNSSNNPLTEEHRVITIAPRLSPPRPSRPPQVIGSTVVGDFNELKTDNFTSENITTKEAKVTSSLSAAKASIDQNLKVTGISTLSGVKATDVEVNSLNVSNRATVNGDLEVNGNIVQKGLNYKTHAEEVYVKNQMVYLRENASKPLGAGEFAGIIAEHYDSDGNSGFIGFDKNGDARVGDIGLENNMTSNSVAICGRSDEMQNKQLTWWNESKRLIDTKAVENGLFTPNYLGIHPEDPTYAKQGLQVDGIRGYNLIKKGNTELHPVYGGDEDQPVKIPDEPDSKKYELWLNYGANGCVRLGHKGKYYISPWGDYYSGTAKTAKGLATADGKEIGFSLEEESSPNKIAVIGQSSNGNPDFKSIPLDNLVVGKARTLDATSQKFDVSELGIKVDGTTSQACLRATITPTSNCYLYQPINITFSAIVYGNDDEWNNSQKPITWTKTIEAGFYPQGKTFYTDPVLPAALYDGKNSWVNFSDVTLTVEVKEAFGFIAE